MPRYLVLAGRVMTSPQDVFAHYTPPEHKVPGEAWTRLRPLAVSWVRKADYTSVHSAHFALRITARFLWWADQQGIPLDAEAIFQPERVEQFIAEQESRAAQHTQANYRGVLSTVGRACTTRAPWSPDPTQYGQHVRVAPPYTDDEIAGFWEAVDQQSTARRSHALRCMLLLAHGAGLKAEEILDITSADVRFHEAGLAVSLSVSDRVVPVLGRYTEDFRALCREHPTGPLVGERGRKTKDPLGLLRKGVAIPPYLPNFAVSRLRTTWLREILDNGLSLREAMAVAGIRSAKTLEAIAPYTKARFDGDEYLFIGSGVPIP